ncbi:MAG: ribulose-phosphate 3-epimerase, partial [Firmicutes bacterium]|nr:ribulose-phosphate 3-epimerase [Bacillota bacterium]
LMIVEPERYVDRFIGSGADIVTIHYEAAKDPKTSLQQIRKRGVKAGISINPDTPVSVLNDLYEYCDLVLLMSVFPGFGGQSFIKESLERLKSLVYHAKHANPNILIEIDGGVTLENASLIKQAGVEILVAGNTIFSSPNYKKAIELLRKG